MRIDRRFVIVVGLSLAWAFVVSVVFYRAASNTDKKPKPQPEKPLVVAVAALPMGAVIAADSVKITRVPEKLFPRGGFSRPEEVLERPVISPIQPDEAVVEARLAARGSGGGVAPLIPPGMRAMAVRVNDVVGVAGFVLPGMRVDVLVTGRAPGRDDTVTSTVLQNINVLSAGKTIQVDSKSQSISVPVVTLLVDPAQAEILTLANNEGHIQLVLRNSGDQNIPKTTGQQLRDLLAIDRPAPSTPAVSRPVSAPVAPRPRAVVVAPRPAAPPPYRVLVIRGNRKTQEAVEPEPHGDERELTPAAEPAKRPEVARSQKAAKLQEVAAAPEAVAGPEAGSGQEPAEPSEPAEGREPVSTEEPRQTQEEGPK